MTASTVSARATGKRVIRRDPRRAEAAAGDLDRRRVLAQELVGGARLGDRPPQVGLGVARALAEPHAVPPVGDDPIEHRRGPLPARHDPDDRRVREAERRHQRVGLGGIAPGLVGLECPRQHEQLVEGRHALPPLRRVGRPSGNGQPEGDRAGVGHHDVEVRGLGDDREVARDPGPDRGERALSAVLLGGDEGHDELAVEPLEVARGRQ